MKITKLVQKQKLTIKEEKSPHSEVDNFLPVTEVNDSKICRNFHK